MTWKPDVQLNKRLLLPRALRSFSDDFHRPAREKAVRAGPHFTLAEMEERDDSEDATYWGRYNGLVSENREQVWDALIAGLEKYNETLVARNNLLTETDALRVQNAELRHLLQQYVSSKVSARSLPKCFAQKETSFDGNC